MKSLNAPMRSQEDVEKQLEHIFQDVNAMNDLNLSKLSSFEKPVFIAQGGKDEIIDAYETIIFKNMLQTNQLHFHWYEDAPHVITVGPILKRLRNDLLAFLMTLDW